MYDDVLVPTDGSEGTSAVVRHAAHCAAREGARLHAVSVIDTRDRFGGDSGDATGATAGMSAAREDARAAVAAVTDRVGSEVPVRTAVESGPPHETLLGYVETHDVDLVVMGTHGRTGLTRYVAGSTTERLVRHSPVPVLTVPLSGPPTEPADG